MQRRVFLGGMFLASVLFLGVGRAPTAPGTFLFVSARDASCRGLVPCYSSIQAAVNAAQPGDTVIIQAGTYREQVHIRDKNDFARASELHRIIIAADSAASAGSVVLKGAGTQCSDGHAVRFQRSKFVTLRGLTITGAGGQAISLMGGNNQNEAIHLERLRIFGNGSGECDGGITIARGNPDTMILNSLVYGNGRNGIATLDADGGPHYVIGNTIHGNAWSGISVTRAHEAFLVNNAVTNNGTAAGSTGGRFGITREAATSPQPAGIRLLNNLICGNRLGEINGPVLDPGDTGNLTPTGGEGPGVSASRGCQNPASVYANVTGPDGRANTADDDFTLAIGSPAIDRGLDPRTLGLASALNPLFEADFSSEAARPKNGSGAATTGFDIGALERFVPDGQAPTVLFIEPLAGASVRQTVAVQAQASDNDKVSALSLTADGKALSASLSPVPPAPSVTGAASWNTTSVADGTHTLAASGRDPSGNLTTVSRVVIVDNTAPDTTITGGPSGPTAESAATFAFTGADNLTPVQNLEFAWRLDGAAFTAFSGATTASFTGLPPGPHTFEVKARDRAGNEDPSPASRSFTVGAGLRVTITEPADGATVPAGFVLVRGSVEANGAETGVTVNGVPAAVQGGVFGASIPLDTSTATITATATAATPATHTIAIRVLEASLALLHVTPSSGPAPLRTGFTVLGAPSGTSVDLDGDGDGFSDTSATVDALSFVYGQPGLYFPAASFTDDHGVRRTVKAVVQVHDVVALDSTLQARWTALKDALRRGDIAQALTNIAGRMRSHYEGMFIDLTGDLPDVDTILTSFRLLEVRRSEAIGEMVRPNGALMESFEIRFRIDDDGVWRLAAF